MKMHYVQILDMMRAGKKRKSNWPDKDPQRLRMTENFSVESAFQNGPHNFLKQIFHLTMHLETNYCPKQKIFLSHFKQARK